MFQDPSFIEYNYFDLWVVAALDSGEPSPRMFTFEDLTSSNLQPARLSRSRGKDISLVAKVAVGPPILLLLQ